MEVKKVKKFFPMLMVLVFVSAFTICATTSVVAEQTWEVDPTDLSNEILNDTEQADLVELVVFAFTIGIIMTILGFAMGIMYHRK